MILYQTSMTNRPSLLRAAIVAAGAVLACAPLARGQCPTTIAPHVLFGTADLPRAVAIGDVNADGKPDMVVANTESANLVTVTLGNGDGTFQAPVGYGTGITPYFVVIGDLNADGRADLATANLSSNNASVLLGNGNGTFQPATNYRAGTRPYHLAVGDVNNDGRPDLAVANSGSANVSILLGNGNGTFQAPLNFATGADPPSVSIGDLNADGKLDLAVPSYTDHNVAVLLGNGNGTFQAAVNYAASTNPQDGEIADLSGDGKLDIAVANYTAGNVSVLIGNGNGIFQPHILYYYGAGATPISLAVGDLNCDGRPDMIVANYGANNVSILQNVGGGNFQAAGNFGVGFNPFGVAVGDVNNDGRPDIAAANHGSSNGSALLNAGPGIAISVHPVNQTNTAGLSAAFSVTVPGAGPYIYRWRRNGVILTNGGNYSGVGTATLTITGLKASLAGAFDVQVGYVVFNTFCTTSNPASLTVKTSCPADIAPAGGNGFVNVDDLLAVINSWGACP